jgi:Uma2 family endonuclease
MGELARRQYTYQDYLTMLEDSGLRLEYLDGEVYAMAGGTPAHSRLAVRAGRLLEGQLEELCAVFGSDMKILASGLTTFPDGSVVCGTLQMAKNDRNVATNPVLLVEVTSPSTEAYDRGPKLKRYQGIASLKVVVFISHRQVEVTVVERRSARWRTTTYGPGETIVLESPPLNLSVNRFYQNITLG